MRPLLFSAAIAVAAVAPIEAAFAWGPEGHEIVGEVALHFLQPSVRTKVLAMLAADTDPLTAHDFLSETNWADAYRDSDRNTTKVRYNATQAWHFTDIEVDAPDLTTACFGMPALPSGMPASTGPASDCSVDKIDEFAAELASPSTSPAERLIALKFVMHFVGDLHQPLHSSDEHDRGGNNKKVTTTSLGSGELHGFWDTQFVQRLGNDPVAVGDALVSRITAANVTTWSKGTPSDWAMEAFDIARDKVYGKLPKPNTSGTYALPASYVTASKAIVTLQLSRAGVRLANVLNAALAGP